MKQILFFLFFIFQIAVAAQTTVSGTITDTKGNPIYGANVYLKGTYDGGSSDENGNFSFSTTVVGIQTLVISFISFEEKEIVADVATLKNKTIKIREDVNTLDAVVISAGSFEAGDNAKVTALKPMDVVTTASALGDFVGALQSLPGTASVSEDGRLFVRGGDAEETQIFIDGNRVFTPYTPSAQNIPTRGRFSPFLFKGITFSTGGYSAEYGQALSSVLLLNTVDEPVEEKTDVQLMTVGVGVGNTQIWGKNSLSINTSYINLAPYQEAFPDRNTWNKPVQAASGEMVYRYRTKNDALLKLYGAFSYTDFDLIQQDINYTDGFRFGLENKNFYFNGSYKVKLEDNWKIAVGISLAKDLTDIRIFEDKVADDETAMHAKVKLKKQFSNRFKISFGSEYFYTKFTEAYTATETFNYGFNSPLFATFLEADIFFSKKLATKIGVRQAYSALLKETTLSPRISLAYKSGKNTQFSLAYGQFYQNPRNEYLKFNTQLKAAYTTQYIANFQYVKKEQIFRIEAYYKAYENLVKYNTEMPQFNSVYSNLGSGYAKGIDVFWRANQKIKNTDYWVSYSYIDTERDYKNYAMLATPNFAPKNNLSVVAKHWVADWKSQIGFSYDFASGRNYTNPNLGGFLNQQTKNYNSVSVNWAYLIDQQKILYFSVNNLLGTQNIFNYRYKNEPNSNGIFERQAIVPNADSFFFIGFFWTISDNKNDNQLNNL